MLIPGYGERCRPARNPSTTDLATSCRLEMRASTFGSRNRVLATAIVASSRPLISQAGLGRRNRFNQPPDDFIRLDAVRFGVKVGQDAVPHHRRGKRLDV